VLSVEVFDSVLEAQTVITDWRTIYNHRRPHSSLGWRPPAAYDRYRLGRCGAAAPTEALRLSSARDIPALRTSALALRDERT
jgi:hypothetical protein